MDTMELLAKFADPEAMKTLTAMQRLAAGLVTTLLGMGITFLALGILQFIIGLMTKLSGYKSPVPAVAQTVPDPVQDQDSLVQDEQLVAAISVALAVQLKTAASNIVIRNIRKIEDHSPVWNRIGITEQMNNN